MTNPRRPAARASALLAPIAIAAALTLGSCVGGYGEPQPTDTCPPIRASVKQISDEIQSMKDIYDTRVGQARDEVRTKGLIALQLMADHPGCFSAESVAAAKVALMQEQQ